MAASGPRSRPPTDWVSGERVFAPPSGTLDVDWLVPAVLEAVRDTVPEATPDQARDALVRAATDGAPGAEPALDDAARVVVAEARRSFRA